VSFLERRAPYVRAHRAALGEVLEEQAAHVLSMWEQQTRAVAVDAVFDRPLWDRELAAALAIRNRMTASDFGSEVADELGVEFDPSELDGFLLSSADLSARNINDLTEEQLRAALGSEDPGVSLALLLSVLVGSRLEQLAESSVTTAANFGRVTGAGQGGAQSKVWRVNSGNPRSSHVQMSGASAGLGEPFSNGMQWPGDPAGGAGENANCQCSVDFE
jgi:hypothetical protein